MSESATGSFSITGDYACVRDAGLRSGNTGQSGAVGGNEQCQSGSDSAIGQCPASGTFITTVPLIWIDEVTTVASVYALSGFMTDITHVGSSGTPLALTGIANAFATVSNLVGVSTVRRWRRRLRGTAHLRRRRSTRWQTLLRAA